METGDGDLQVLDLVPLTGGYSLFTARFTAVTATGRSDYVLRADPPGDAALTQTDRQREWALLNALTTCGGVPMPDAKWADIDGRHLGTPAIVLDFVDGPQLLGHLQSADSSTQTDLALQLASTIGAVHRLGAAAAPSCFEQPSSWGDYIDGFIAGWRQVEAAHVEHSPFIRWVASWLDTHRPPPAPLTLVHGEFQTGNVMIGPDGEMQVIDWEYSHIGDPRVDLGWIQNVAAFSPPDPIALDPIGFCARYCEVTGLSEEIINPLTVGWFSILAGYKALGGLLQGISAMATGQNRLITSAYLVSAMPFSHRMWRQGVAGMEAAMAAMETQLEAVS
ncbi:MAG TPA: phosphotransferase family protein [Acidimicrobiales bacterium]|nr:phosphotransferase family protein [Acidimicrobiales bacterium]